MAWLLDFENLYKIFSVMLFEYSVSFLLKIGIKLSSFWVLYYSISVSFYCKVVVFSQSVEFKSREISWKFNWCVEFYTVFIGMTSCDYFSEIKLIISYTSDFSWCSCVGLENFCAHIICELSIVLLDTSYWLLFFIVTCD